MAALSDGVAGFDHVMVEPSVHFQFVEPSGTVCPPVTNQSEAYWRTLFWMKVPSAVLSTEPSSPPESAQTLAAASHGAALFMLTL